MSQASCSSMASNATDRQDDPLTAWTIVPTVEALRHKLAEMSSAYRQATPYPHIVLDDFLPWPVARAMAEHFPSPTDARVWTRLPTDDQRGKSSLRHESCLPVAMRRLVHELNSHTMIDFLEDLSGIKGLISDPRLVGGGLHQTHAGGRLSVHIDYSHHPQYQLFRRMNLILYLSPDWQESFGGHFELWDERATACQARVLPVFNRCVVFSTRHRSYHGQPEPLSCPADRTRNSVALYYYTNESHGTDRSEPTHNTIFRSRPGETASLGTRLIRAASGGLLRDLLPPICYRALRRIWNRPRS